MMVGSLIVSLLSRRALSESCRASFVQFGATTAATDDAGAVGAALLLTLAWDAELMALLWGDDETAADPPGVEVDGGS
jgi:hypothetical protein